MHTCSDPYLASASNCASLVSEVMGPPPLALRTWFVELWNCGMGDGGKEVWATVATGNDGLAWRIGQGWAARTPSRADPNGPRQARSCNKQTLRCFCSRLVSDLFKRRLQRPAAHARLLQRRCHLAVLNLMGRTCHETHRVHKAQGGSGPRGARTAAAARAAAAHAEGAAGGCACALPG
jgi:hypothetical protein